MRWGAKRPMSPNRKPENQVRVFPITPRAIRHLPAARQRRYVRLAVLDVLREAERDLNALEVQERTGLDARTVRGELHHLTATREVEKIHRRGSATYRLIGQPSSPFAKHLVRLKFGTYSIDHILGPNGSESLVIQERAESKDGLFEPVGGILIRKEDLDLFLEAMERRVEDELVVRRKTGKV